MSWTHPESTERKLRTSDALAIQLPSSSRKGLCIKRSWRQSIGVFYLIVKGMENGELTEDLSVGPGNRCGVK